MTAKAAVDMVTSTSVVADGGSAVLSFADEKWQ